MESLKVILWIFSTCIIIAVEEIVHIVPQTSWDQDREPSELGGQNFTIWSDINGCSSLVWGDLQYKISQETGNEKGLLATIKRKSQPKQLVTMLTPSPFLKIVGKGDSSRCSRVSHLGRSDLALTLTLISREEQHKRSSFLPLVIHCQTSPKFQKRSANTQAEIPSTTFMHHSMYHVPYHRFQATINTPYCLEQNWKNKANICHIYMSISQVLRISFILETYYSSSWIRKGETLSTILLNYYQTPKAHKLSKVKRLNINFTNFWVVKNWREWNLHPINSDPMENSH